MFTRIRDVHRLRRVEGHDRSWVVFVQVKVVSTSGGLLALPSTFTAMTGPSVSENFSDDVSRGEMLTENDIGGLTGSR